MAQASLTYEDFKSRISMSEVLQAAGYQLNRKDGLRYPSYVRVGSDGRRIKGDKFIVSGQGKCCFQPPERKNYNIISFIKSYPHLFTDYRVGMSLDRLVNLLCNRILNQPMEERASRILDPEKERKPFTLTDYELTSDAKHIAKFLIPRKLSQFTQKAFAPYMFISYKKREDGKQFGNISFPLTKAGSKHVIGMEVRGFPTKDGKSGFKGLAAGSNSSEGVWMAAPNHPELPKMRDIKAVYWFESAYDAMAFYQLKGKWQPTDSLYISTSGTPTDGQMRQVLEFTPRAAHRLCFDNDEAGRKFTEHFKQVAASMDVTTVKEFNQHPDFKDWNDRVMGIVKESVAVNAKVEQAEEVVAKEIPKSYSKEEEEAIEETEEEITPKLRR